MSAESRERLAITAASGISAEDGEWLARCPRQQVLWGRASTMPETTLRAARAAAKPHLRLLSIDAIEAMPDPR
jgi:hypothetical protein